MAITVQKAKREKIYVKVALMGTSGSGKTYSGLRLATGMVEEIEKEMGKKAKVLMCNTESSRGRYYANEFDYDIVDIDAPFSPERFIEVIDFAVDNGYDVLLMDSVSQEWEGKGGCLELHQQAGGQYQDWKNVTPRHQKFINAIISSKIHIIATMRGKEQYEISKNEKGKNTVQKLGVGAQQRGGFEYEFTCTFLIDQKSSMAEYQKDNTHIFDTEGAVLLSEDYGRRIIQWANASNVEPKINLSSVISKIDSLARSLVADGIDKNQVFECISGTNGMKNSNYNAITDIEIAQAVYENLSKLASNIEIKGDNE